ncbi:SpoIIE family protein phosphatase [Ilumatobacter sp.]|uniref:SpoIIE family protein phosphatase n=1 Tax=Ilumatobacter sp. TaxID=1967498 RepID=UPI003C64F10C
MTDGITGYQQLLEFFYQCPVGLISFADDGTVHQINPAAVRLITNASHATEFENVFDCLARPWPGLRGLVEGHPESGTVVDSFDLIGERPQPIVVDCSVVRVGENQVMLVLADATTLRDAEHQRAELLDSERRARQQLETLERNATHLASAVTAEEVAASVTSELTTALGLELTSIRVRRGDQLVLLPGPGLGSGLANVVEDLPASIALPGIEAAVSNRSFHLESFDAVRDRYPIFDEYDARIGSIVAMPLRAADKSAIGSLVIGAGGERWFDDDVLSLIGGLAVQTGLALERTQLFEEAVRAGEQEHDIAMRLQRALLPDSVVDAPGVTIAAQVSAAANLMTVGGDWYDTFAWPTGEVAVIVGDVVGHDVESAAKMGRLRAALAALAPEVGPSPAALLDALNRIAHGVNGVDFATAICVVLDSSTGTVRYSIAGHPPAIVVDADGRTRLLDGAVSPPVGVVRHVDRTEHDTAIEPNSSIVLFSDGLVEHRGEAIDLGIDRLGRQLAAASDLDAHELVAHIMDLRSASGPLEDDAIALVLRWDGVRDTNATP